MKKKIEIYTTPTCGFCKQLKEFLTEHKIDFETHDVSSSKKSLEEMKSLSNGNMSVPVMVINKGGEDQVVTIGYDEAVNALP